MLDKFLFCLYIKKAARQFNEKLEATVKERTAELEEANRNLTRILERYHGTLDNMLEGCQIIGFDWKHLYINDAAARQSGFIVLRNCRFKLSELAEELRQILSRPRSCPDKKTCGTSRREDMGRERIREGKQVYICNTDETESRIQNSELRSQKSELKTIKSAIKYNKPVFPLREGG